MLTVTVSVSVSVIVEPSVGKGSHIGVTLVVDDLVGIRRLHEIREGKRRNKDEAYSVVELVMNCVGAAQPTSI